MDEWFHATARVVEDMGGKAFRVRVPGGAAIFALSWLGGFFFQALFRKGVKLVVLQNHHDCAWIKEMLTHSRFVRAVARLLRIKQADKFNAWILDRARRNVELFARKRGWSTPDSPVIVLTRLDDPHYCEVDPAIHKALMQIAERAV